MAWTTPAVRSTGTLITAAIWNEQVRDNLEFLGSSHDHSGHAGDGATIGAIPSGIILIFDTSCPTNWTRVSAFDSKFLRGASSYGGTGGTTGHTHSYNSHYHTHTHSGGYTIGGASGTVNVDTGSGTTSGKAMNGHTHTYGPSDPDTGSATQAGGNTNGPGTDLPPYINVVFCKRN